MPPGADRAARLGGVAVPFADVETSSDAYALRFSGPVGEWFLGLQTRLTLEALRGFGGGRALDVGGGHAQLTGPLLDAGFHVTVLASDEVCRSRVSRWVDAGQADFRVGDLLHMPLENGSFDLVLAYRLLPHVDVWPRLLGEMSRVASRAVIFDYPTRRSVNAVSDLLFGIKRGVEGDTRPFTVFRDAEVARVLRELGFEPVARLGEFVLPMALHRALGWAPLSRASEGVAAGLGLRRLLGSPVILRADRR